MALFAEISDLWESLEDGKILIVEGHALVDLFEVPARREFFRDSGAAVISLVVDKKTAFKQRFERKDKHEKGFPYLEHAWKWAMIREEKLVNLDGFSVKSISERESLMDRLLWEFAEEGKDLPLLRDQRSWETPEDPVVLEDYFADDPIFSRALAMVTCVALGDAYGAPYELTFKPDPPYEANLSNVLKLGSRFGPARFAVPGQVTDDTAMTAMVLEHISLFDVRNNLWYDKDKMIKRYIAWARSKPAGMGKNTGHLFNVRGRKIPDRVKAYEDVLQIKKDSGTVSASNGSLMRASPFAIIPDREEAVKFALIDTDLTNPHPHNRAATRLYVGLLHDLVHAGEEDPMPTAEDLVRKCEQITDWTKSEELEVQECVKAALLSSEPRDLGKPKKGWVLNALWCALRAYKRLLQTPEMDFEEYILPVYKLSEGKSDTDSDTNAAIAGAIYGAKHGWSTLLAQEKTREDIKTLFSAPYELSQCRHGEGAPEPSDFVEIMQTIKKYMD